VNQTSIYTALHTYYTIGVFFLNNVLYYCGITNQNTYNMKKRNLKKLQLNKKSISRIQEQAIAGGDVSLPNPATGNRCDMTGANFCVSWNACNTQPINITCIYTGPTKPIDTIALTADCVNTIDCVTNVGC
jgi:hypothetical protein